MQRQISECRQKLPVKFIWKKTICIKENCNAVRSLPFSDDGESLSAEATTSPRFPPSIKLHDFKSLRVPKYLYHSLPPHTDRVFAFLSTVLLFNLTTFTVKYVSWEKNERIRCVLKAFAVFLVQCIPLEFLFVLCVSKLLKIHFYKKAIKMYIVHNKFFVPLPKNTRRKINETFKYKLSL